MNPRAIFGFAFAAGASYVLFSYLFSENLDGTHYYEVVTEYPINDGDTIDAPGNVKINGDDFASGAAEVPDVWGELDEYNAQAARYTQTPIDFPYMYDTENDYYDWEGMYDYWG